MTVSRSFSRFSFRILFLSVLAAACFVHGRDAATELKKIDALLDSVKSSDVIFIRNGSEYTAQEAHDHLRKKLRAGQNSWFAPPREEWTAKMFIEKIGSRSSISRKPYQVRFKNGKTVESRAWLTEMLRGIEATSAAP